MERKLFTGSQNSVSSIFGDSRNFQFSNFCVWYFSLLLTSFLWVFDKYRSCINNLKIKLWRVIIENQKSLGQTQIIYSFSPCLDQKSQVSTKRLIAAFERMKTSWNSLINLGFREQRGPSLDDFKPALSPGKNGMATSTSNVMVRWLSCEDRGGQPNLHTTPNQRRSKDCAAQKPHVRINPTSNMLKGQLKEWRKRRTPHWNTTHQRTQETRVCWIVSARGY